MKLLTRVQATENGEISAKGSVFKLEETVFRYTDQPSAGK